MNTQDHKQALPPGFRLGSYRVMRVLGAGGFGVTYLCEHGGLGVTVAVKEYLPNDIAVRSGNAVAPKSTADREGYQWGLSRFLDEARTLARFEHRNVVRVRDYFEANGTAYIVMDYEDGEPLDSVLERKGTLTEAQIKRVLLPIVAGLRQMHAAGFLHRDVKPANIFIRRSDESPVLLDFGSARQALSSRSRSVTAIASAGYSPPEQYESDGEQGPWTDIYALSALCYRAITAMAPVEATRRQSRLLRDEEDPLPRLAEVAGGRCSRAFLEAVDRGLRVVERERQGSLDEWWAELEGGAGEAANASTAVRPAPREGRGLTTPAEIEGGRSRRPLGVIALLLVGLLVQAVALWELLGVLGRSLRRSRSSGEIDPDVMSGLLALPVAAAVALALLGRRPKREVIALLLVGLVVQVVALWELVTVLGSARGVVYGFEGRGVRLAGPPRSYRRLRRTAWMAAGSRLAALASLGSAVVAAADETRISAGGLVAAEMEAKVAQSSRTGRRDRPAEISRRMAAMRHGRGRRGIPVFRDCSREPCRSRKSRNRAGTGHGPRAGRGGRPHNRNGGCATGCRRPCGRSRCARPHGGGSLPRLSGVPRDGGVAGGFVPDGVAVVRTGPARQ